MANGWDEVNETLDAIQKGGAFYKMIEGNNRMRLLEIPKKITSHYVQAEKKSYTCIGTGCSFCMKGEKARTQFMVQAIIRGLTREQDVVQIVKLGSTIMEALRTLKNDPDWTFSEVPNYDITVVMKKTGPQAVDVEYNLVASPNKAELTDAEKEMLSKIKPVSEIVQKMVDKAKGEVNQPALAAPATDEIRVEDIPF